MVTFSNFSQASESERMDKGYDKISRRLINYPKGIETSHDMVCAKIYIMKKKCFTSGDITPH